MIDTSLIFLDQLRTENAPEQWQRLVDLYSPLLRSWLARYDDLGSADKDDVMQEALLAVARELPAFEHNQRPGAFRCWLRRILVHRRASGRARPAACDGSSHGPPRYQA